MSFGLTRRGGKTENRNCNLLSAITLSQQLNLTSGVGISSSQEGAKNLQINTSIGYTGVKNLLVRVSIAENRGEKEGKLVNRTQNLLLNTDYKVSFYKKPVDLNFGYGYNLSGVDAKTKSQLVSFGFGLPITTRMGCRYSYSLNKSSSLKTHGNVLNLSLHGAKKPYSVNTIINLVKAEELTKNISASMSYPLGKSLSLSISSHYTKKEGIKPTYNLNSSVGYSF